MLVYEYVNSILPELNSNYNDYNMIMKSKILSIITSALNIEDKVNYLELNYTQILETNNELARVLFLLGLEDDNYVKYYILDLVTGGDLITGLVKNMTGFAQRNILFRLEFDNNSFMSVKSVPTLHLIYKCAMKQLYIDGVIYDQLINGMMEMDDAYSIIADLLIVLNPSKSLDFLRNRLYSQINIIRCSDKRSISIREYVTPIHSSPLLDIQLKANMVTQNFYPTAIGNVITLGEFRISSITNDNISIPLGYFCNRVGITEEQLRNTL